MSFLENFFHKEKKIESVAFIDIAADSVAGAYAQYAKSETPVILYARRLPIDIRTDEPHETALLRALQTLGDELIREGAPVLLRASGSGSADTILVSIDAPWGEITLRTEKLERESSFIFTKSIVDTVLKNTATVPPEKTYSE